MLGALAESLALIRDLPRMRELGHPLPILDIVRIKDVRALEEVGLHRAIQVAVTQETHLTKNTTTLTNS